MPSYLKTQVDKEIVKSFVKEAPKRVKEIKKEISAINRNIVGRKVVGVVNKIESSIGKAVSKIGNAQLKNRKVIKDSKTSYKVYVKDVNLLEKAQKDKARNYKEVYEEEKRSLFFK